MIVSFLRSKSTIYKLKIPVLKSKKHATLSYILPSFFVDNFLITMWIKGNVLSFILFLHSFRHYFSSFSSCSNMSNDGFILLIFFFHRLYDLWLYFTTLLIRKNCKFLKLYACFYAHYRRFTKITQIITTTNFNE